MTKLNWAVPLVALLSFYSCSVLGSQLDNPQQIVERLLSDIESETERTIPPEVIRRIAEVAQRQPGIDSEVARAEESELKISEVRANWFPQVEVGLRQRSSIETAERLGYDSGSRLDAVAQASQLIYDFGATSSRVAAAEYESQARQLEVQSALESTVLELLAAHYNVVRAGTKHRLALENLRSHEETLSRVQEQLTAGTASTADELRVRSQLERSRSDVVELQSQLETASAIYEELYFEPPVGLGVIPAGARAPIRLADGLQKLRDSNVTIQVAAQNALAASQAGRAIRQDRLPNLSLDLQVRHFDLDDSDEAETDAAVLLSLNYPLFTGGAAGSRSAQAEQRDRQQRFDQLAIQRQLERVLRAAYSDLGGVRQQAKAQYLTLEAEQKTVEAYREQFRIGRRTLNDLLDAQQALFEAQKALIDLKIDERLIEFRQKALIGALLTEFNLGSTG